MAICHINTGNISDKHCTNHTCQIIDVSLVRCSLTVSSSEKNVCQGGQNNLFLKQFDVDGGLVAARVRRLPRPIPDL